MTSRRRSSNKNLGNSISDVRRRLKYLERKPIRTKLQNRVIKAAAIAPSSITADEVDFGTTVITNENPADVIDNPKEGLGVINPDNGEYLLFSSDQNDYIAVADANAQATADGKNTIYYQTTAPSSASLKTNDIWYDTDDGNKLYVWNGTAWVNIQDTAIAAAAAAATAAQSTADGKNKVYRQDAQPSGGTYVSGDIWFDTDDNNKIYRYSGSAWVAVQLGGNALANISANSITTGTIDASVITVSSINASNISTGTLAASRIAANSLDVSVLQAGTLRSGTIYTGNVVASQITTGTITAAVSMTSASIIGGTIQQGSSGNYILMDQTDKATIKFYVTGYTYPGYISVESSYGGTLGQMSLQGPTTGAETDPASVGLYGENMYLDAGYINIESTGNFSLGNSSDGIQIKYAITTSPSGPYIHSIRNIWQSLNSSYPTPGAGDGEVGDVWLTY